MKTLTSKNALSNLPPQNPLAATSSLALSSVLAVWRESDSPLSGWRWGSMETSWQTSVRRLARRSRTSLCLMMGASSWLTTLPIDAHGFALHKGGFRDALCLRYNWAPPHLPTKCACGSNFTIDHALSCPTGGFTISDDDRRSQSLGLTKRPAKQRNATRFPRGPLHGIPRMHSGIHLGKSPRGGKNMSEDILEGRAHSEQNSILKG